MTDQLEVFKRHDEFYYSGKKLLSLNAKINIVFGGWGNGKSYYYQKELICGEIRSGFQVVYVRRTKDEAERNGMQLAGVIQEAFPEYDVKYVKKAGAPIITLNGEIVVYCPNVRGGAMWKSFDLEGFKRVSWIVYDEFIPENKVKFNGEWEQWVRLTETFTRHFTDKRIILIGNTVTKENTYYDHYFYQQGHDFPTPDTINYYKDHSFAVERAITSEWLQKQKRFTSTGYMVGLDLDSQALVYNADFVNPNDHGVRKNMPELITAFNFNLCYRGVEFGVYNEGPKWRIQEPTRGKPTYALDPLDSVTKLYPEFPQDQAAMQKTFLRACQRGMITFRTIAYRDAVSIWLSRIYHLRVEDLVWTGDKAS